MKEELIRLDESYLPEIAQMYRAAFAGDPWNDDWSDEAQLIEYIRDVSCYFKGLNYGLLIDGKLSAVALGSIRHWWEGTNYDLEELCVDTSLQGLGIGSRFMKLVEQDIKSMGLAGIFLQTDNDMPAYKFYKKNGYRELTEHVSFYKSVK